MNIQQAREKIKQAKVEKSNQLNLAAFDERATFAEEKLTSKDLVELLPEIKQLTRLKKLDLIANQISDGEVLKELTNLKVLYLGYNQISDISVLGRLTNLTELYLGYNQISDISVLRQLTNLTELYLNNNQISDISVLGQLTNLTRLNINKNQISDIKVLEQLMNLTSLYLSHNPISDIGVLRQLSKLQLLLIQGNPKMEKLLPEEVINDFTNPQRIINYFLKVKDGKPINEAKIVVVGEADYGKTLLINRLVYDEYIPTERTHGIIITKWEDVRSMIKRSN